MFWNSFQLKRLDQTWDADTDAFDSRQSTTDKAADTLKPDSQKSTLEQATDSVKSAGDSVASTLQPGTPPSLRAEI